MEYRAVLPGAVKADGAAGCVPVGGRIADCTPYGSARVKPGSRGIDDASRGNSAHRSTGSIPNCLSSRRGCKMNCHFILTQSLLRSVRNGLRLLRITPDFPAYGQ